MEKQLKEDCVQFNVTSGVTIEEFNEKYNQLVYYLKDKYGYITDVKISRNSYEYNDGEDYEEVINNIIIYKRYETDEEFIRRTNWAQMRKAEQEERELKLLKQYIELHTDEAIKYINSLTKK